MLSLRLLLRSRCHFACIKPVDQPNAGVAGRFRLLHGRKQQRRRAHGRAPAPAAFQYFATCHPGLEPALVEELQNPNLEADSIEAGYSGAAFRGAGWRTGYLANLWLRTALRVLVLQKEGYLDAGGRDTGPELYDFFRRAAPWGTLLPRGYSFSVEARVSGRLDVNEQYLRLRARDAICDAVRDAGEDKPQPPPPGCQADLPLFIYLQQDTLTLYRDMSGRSLHNRDYRAAIHRAGLNAAAAAGILLLAGWPELAGMSDGAALADPMCGSGTFLIEAALMATHTAPGLSRADWPFQSWPEFDPRLWEDCIGAAADAQRRWHGQLLGCDSHPGALSLAKSGASAAGVARMIGLHQGPCQHWQPADTPSMVVCNPPWGHRLLGSGPQPFEAAGAGFRAGAAGGLRRSPVDREADAEAQELELAWKHLSTFLKGQCRKADVFLLSGNANVTKHLHMRATKRLVLGIGGVDCRLLHYKVLPPKQS